jgi:vacuolar-type H+-ATPase subunit E/Vma4
MSLDNIINRILDDAYAKAKTLKDSSYLRSQDLLARAEEEAGLASKRILDEARRKASEESERASIAHSLDVKKEILKKKVSLIDSAFAAAHTRLIELDDKKYCELLEAGIKGLNEKEGKLIFSKRDSQRIKERFVEDLNRRWALRLKFGGYFNSSDGGFILEKDRLRIDMTFRTLFKALRERLLFDISRILFE